MTEKEINIRNDSGMEITDYAIEAIAKSLLPIIQTYYESEVDKQAQKCKQHKNKRQKTAK